MINLELEKEAFKKYINEKMFQEYKLRFNGKEIPKPNLQEFSFNEFKTTIVEHITIISLNETPSVCRSDYFKIMYFENTPLGVKLSVKYCICDCGNMWYEVERSIER